MKPWQLTRIDRYLARQLALALVAVTTGLVALGWLMQSLRFVETVANRGLSIGVFLRLSGLGIPGLTATVLPITTFVVVQFIYERITTDRELTVMRAAGLSQFALARPALAVAGITMAFCFLLNLWIVPSSFTAFRQYEFEVRNKLAAFLLQEGVFNQMSDDLTVYVRLRQSDGELRGILIDDARDPNSHATILAETGRLIAGAASPQVLLINGSRQTINHQTGRLEVGTFKEYTMDLAQASKTEAQRFRDAGEMGLSELLNPPRGTELADRNAGKFIVEAHRRLSAPFTVMSFAMVALVSVLSGAFSRHGGLIRPVVAVITVVGLLALGLVLNNLAARIPGLVPLIWMAAILPGLGCAVYLFGPEVRFAAGLRRSAA
jgi:lipopolysaccharide export system permease protein